MTKRGRNKKRNTNGTAKNVQIQDAMPIPDESTGPVPTGGKGRDRRYARLSYSDSIYVPPWYCTRNSISWQGRSVPRGGNLGTDEWIEEKVYESKSAAMVLKKVKAKFTAAKVEIRNKKGSDVPQEMIDELEMLLFSRGYTAAGKGTFKNVREDYIKQLHLYCNGACVLILGKSELVPAPAEDFGFTMPDEIPGPLMQAEGENKEPLFYENGQGIFATGFMVLPAGTWRRTGVDAWPVLYTSPYDDKTYLLHSSRVVLESQQPSSSPRMYGVGRSDMWVVKYDILQEILSDKRKAGEKVPLELLVIRKGDIEPKDVKDVLKDADEKGKHTLPELAQARGVLGLDRRHSATDEELIIDKITLDSYQNLSDISIEDELAITVRIGAANGVTPYELGLGSVLKMASRATSEAEEKAAKVAGIDSELDDFLNELTMKALPDGLEFVATIDTKPDAKEQAEIDNLNARTAQIYIDTGVINPELARAQLVREGVITQEEADTVIAGGSVASVEVKGNTAPSDDFFHVDTERLNEDYQAWWNNEVNKQLLDVVQGEEPRQAPTREAFLASVDLESYRKSDADQYLTPSETKAINDDIATYEQKLNDIATLAASGDITEDESEERMAILARAMIIIYMLLGSELNNPALLNESGQILLQNARAILRNAGLTSVTPTASQTARLTANIAAISDEQAIIDAFPEDGAEALGDVNRLTDIHEESAGTLTRNAIALGLANADLGEVRFAEAIRLGLRNQINLWGNKVREFRAVGQLYDPRNPNFMWQRGRTIEGCADCIRLNGDVRTAREWRQFKRETGLYPRSRDLACSGFNCECNWIRVTQ